MTVTRVIIVGGGITGSVLALDLQQRGITPMLIEISPTWEASGHGITLQGNLLRVLRRVGVADEIIGGGFPYHGFATRTASGELIEQVNAPPLGGPSLPPSTGAMRPFVQEVLSRAVHAAGIEVRLGTRVTAFRDRPGCIEVTLSDGTVDTFDLLVGADGAHSSIRPMLGIDACPAPIGMSIWRVVARRPADVMQTNLFLGGPHYVAGLCPVSPSHMYGYLVDEDIRRSRTEGAPFHEILRERLDGYGGWWEEVRRSVGPDSAIDYRSLELMLVDDPWYRGHAIIIGDAAHVCPPMLAQGAAMGAEDAAVLGDCLATEGDLPTLLSTFMARRMPRVRMVVDTSMGVARREMAGQIAATETEANLEQMMADAMVTLSKAP
jgi:2-polyprenyl-6-methoxyphenol hydroxylase-like FAD-dependent oxidoreductase